MVSRTNRVLRIALQGVHNDGLGDSGSVQPKLQFTSLIVIRASVVDILVITGTWRSGIRRTSGEYGLTFNR